jgi:hypothetical protein
LNVIKPISEWPPPINLEIRLLVGLTQLLIIRNRIGLQVIRRPR